MKSTGYAWFKIVKPTCSHGFRTIRSSLWNHKGPGPGRAMLSKEAQSRRGRFRGIQGLGENRLEKLWPLTYWCLAGNGWVAGGCWEYF